NTLASFCIVVAIIVTAAVTEHRFVAHSLLISFFLIITSPVTAMLLMRAAIKRELQRREDQGTVSENAPEVKLEGSSLPEEEAGVSGRSTLSTRPACTRLASYWLTIIFFVVTV